MGRSRRDRRPRPGVRHPYLRRRDVDRIPEAAARLRRAGCRCGPQGAGDSAAGSRPAIRSRSTGETVAATCRSSCKFRRFAFWAHTAANGYDTVGLRIFTATVDYDIDVANGKIVRGDKMLHPVAVDVLAERSSDAQTKPEGGTLRERCPNCGAGLQLEWDGSCRFCKTDIMSGQYDWVISKIIQLADWDQALSSCPPDILQK